MGTFDWQPVNQKHGKQPELATGIWSGGQSCGTEPLTCGMWCHLQVDSVRIELNCSILSWCLRIGWWCGNTHTYQIWVQNRTRVGCRRRPPEGRTPEPMRECKALKARKIHLTHQWSTVPRAQIFFCKSKSKRALPGQVWGCEEVKTCTPGSEDFTNRGRCTGLTMGRRRKTTSCRGSFKCETGSARRWGWRQAGDFSRKVSGAHKHVLFVKHQLPKFKTLGTHTLIWILGFS